MKSWQKTSLLFFILLVFTSGIIVLIKPKIAYYDIIELFFWISLIIEIIISILLKRHNIIL